MMNSIVQAIPGYHPENVLSASPFGRLKDIAFNPKFWIVSVLLMAIVISALSVVYVQAQNRILFSQLSSLQNIRNASHVEWGQLLLEESTWSTQARIQQIAEQQLGMVAPKQKNIVIVQ